MIFRKLIKPFLFILFFLGIFVFFGKPDEVKQVIVGGKTFNVEIARTKTELERGLSLHVPLKSDEGMLFVFQKEDLHGFWMKDMSFSLDILWIDSNLRISHIEKNVSPDTYPRIFNPNSKNLYVLEILAGQADSLKIKNGDMVKFVRE